MNFSDDFSFNRDYQKDINEVKKKILDCKEYISSGQNFNYLETIEEGLHLCMEEDLPEDGIELADAVLNIAPYNSEFWQFKGIFLKYNFRV
jgi:hypothetical protein